jgi:hypothetical protein
MLVTLVTFTQTGIPNYSSSFFFFGGGRACTEPWQPDWLRGTGRPEEASYKVGSSDGLRAIAISLKLLTLFTAWS